MPDKKLIVIDGSSLIYRAFFALPPLTTADGTPTNAVYGFTGMLVKLLEDERPDVILIAFEGGRTFRHAEFADYKAHRPRTPDDLAVQTPIARAVAEALRIPVLQYQGYEADDVIGTVACRGAAAGFNVVIVTGDMDTLQLVNDRVSVLTNRRGVTDILVYDEAAVLERYGLPPALLPDFKALKGDASDNIPGIPGIGDKTATALLAEYGSLEALLDHAEQVKAKRVRENLIAGRETAILYKRLATIVTDLPLEMPFDEWQYAGPDLPRVRELFQALEFRTLARRLEQFGGGAPGMIEEEPVPAAEASSEYRLPAAGSELDQWADRAREAGVVAVRSRQVGGEGRTGALRTVALHSAGETVLIKVGGAESGEGGLFATVSEEAPQLPDSVRRLLQAEEVRWLGYDLKREFHALRDAGVEQSRAGFDALVAAYVLNPGRANYRLEDLVREHAGLTLANGDEDVALASEVTAIAALAGPMLQRLREEELEYVYETLELPLIRILADMEALGVGVDCDELRRLSERLGDRIRDLEQHAYAAAGCEFNLGSPKQLQEILFTRLELPATKKTKTGYSTDSDVLQDLAVVHPLPELVLEWRELAKLKSTYADALQNLVDPRDRRIHTRLNQTVAATGRLSSSDPNLQNIPIRTEVGREIRAAFIPAPGMRLLSADYSQIELRIMAHVSGDPELVRAFQADQDVHAATAARVFGVPLEAVTPDQRRSAKTVNFAVLYGQREFGLSRQLRIAVREARELIEAYFERFPGVLQYAEDTLRQARDRGYVTTLPPYQRKRLIPGIHAGNRNERLAAEREAVNAPIQGTAADIIKAAMLRVSDAMRGRGLRSRMILQVHDELLFEVDPAEIDMMVRLVRHEMEQAFTLRVPLKVEVKVGENWRDVEPASEAGTRSELL